MNDDQLKEVGDLDTNLSQNVNFSYLIPGYSGSSLGDLCTQLLSKNAFDPNEVIPFLHSLLTHLGLGLCVPKPLSTQSLTNFASNFEKDDFKTIQMRCFILRVYQKFDNHLRSSFLRSICSMCKVDSESYSDSYKLFKYIEDTGYVHSRDETGLFFIFKALATDAKFLKVLNFAEELIIKGMYIYCFCKFDLT